MKETILFVPGMACTQHIWEALELLPHHFDCHFLDWPSEETKNWTGLEEGALWLEEQIKNYNAKIVIGHSLGGLALLKVLERKQVEITHSIVIETFLSPPPDFFKQFVGPYASTELEENLHDMFNANRDSFSENFRKFIRENINEKLFKLSKINNTFFIYGLRGEENSEKVLEMLPYLQNLNDTNSIGLMPYSAHFPMIEEPQDLEETISEFLDGFEE